MEYYDPISSGTLYVTEAPFNPGSGDTAISSGWATPFEGGAAGPAGPAGPTGNTGPRGPAGATGLQGPQGLQGPAGPQGERGATGATGDAGSTGPQGPRGDQGPVGPQGPAGPQGPQGDEGPQGPAGSQGPAGPTGSQGPAGANGADGTNGTDGRDGATGPAGPQGPQGPAGPQGPTGPAGTSPNDANIDFTGGDVTSTSHFTTNQGDDEDIVLTIGDNRVTAAKLDVADNGATGQVLGSDGDGSFSWLHPNDANVLAFNDTANSGTTLGVDFTEVGTTITATVDASSISGGSSIPPESARLSLNHTSFQQNASGDTTVTGTLTVNSPYSFAGTGSLAGTGGNETISVVDGDGNAITFTHSNLTDTTFTFTVTATEKQTVQTIRAHANVFATYNSTVHSAAVSATIRIVAPIPDWFSELDTTAPTNNAGMTNRGDFTSGVRQSFAALAGMSRNLYISLPTRSAGYTFKSGELFLNNTTITWTQAGYTLYQITDFYRWFSW